MRIAVFGLGYVGVVSAACLADGGHEVIGVDVNENKVAAVNDGRTTVLEERIGDLVADGVSSGRLRATTSVAEAIAATDMCFICVGTPSAPNGSLSTLYLERVADQVGGALPRDRRYVVVVRSTMLPGTCDRVVVPRLEAASGMRARDGFGVCVHPEFLREGSSVADFFDPPKTVVGGDDESDMALVSGVYAGFAGPTFHVARPVAEIAKYVDNSFHALKVAFANEIGALCKVAGVDSYEVMDVFKADTKLNISTAYLTPGWAFGGSCLPKDVRAVTHHARHVDVAVPVLDAILRSNDVHFERAVELVEATGHKRIGLFGLAFKQGTDDLRESPMVRLAERLVGRGFDVLIHDANVSTSHLVGANREYVETHLPHLSRLLRGSVDDVLAHAEVCVVGSRSADAVEATKRAEHRPVIDLVRLPEVDAIERYEGICWS
jgi:GDP-mannose 6-dehydrogenase